MEVNYQNLENNVCEIADFNESTDNFDNKPSKTTKSKNKTPSAHNTQLALMAVDQFSSQLRTYFYNRLRSHNDVEDLMQELYCRLLTYQHPLRVKSFKSFVFTIALNLLRDKSRRTVTRMATKMTSIDEAEEIPAEITDPNRVIEGIEQLEITGEAIERLQPACKKAFYLHRIYGLSHREIAEHLGVTVSMVEKHIMGAVKFLRGELASAT